MSGDKQKKPSSTPDITSGRKRHIQRGLMQFSAGLLALKLASRLFFRRKLTNLTSTTSPNQEDETAIERVLVIGGTGCLGAPTAKALKAAGYDVSVVSRGARAEGKPYGAGPGGSQNAYKLQQEEQLKAMGVRLHVADRVTRREEFCALLRAGKYDIIVDFWAMNKEHVEDVFGNAAVGTLKHYVFISSNMVYKGGPETFDVSVQNDAELNERDIDVEAYAQSVVDSYGARKVYCEAYLAAMHQSERFPYTAIRLPSAVGAAADWRHSKLQAWIENGNPIDPAGGKGTQFRVIYSGDVATAVLAVLRHKEKTLGLAINFAQAERPTLSEYLQCCARAMDKKPVRAGFFSYSQSLPDAEPLCNYENQGVLDTTLAEKLLAWEPTPMETWMEETVEWHKNGFPGGDLAIGGIDNIRS